MGFWRASRRTTVLCSVLRCIIQRRRLRSRYAKCNCRKALPIPQTGSNVYDRLGAGALEAALVQCLPAA